MNGLILKTENLKIMRVDKSLYKIELNQSSYALINSLIKTKLIKGASTDETYKTIIFKGESVKSLKEYQDEYKKRSGTAKLLVSDVAKMIRSLTIQLQYLLENEFSTIIGYAPENIIVINDEIFAFLGSELVANFDADSEEAMISCPYSPKDFFFSLELLKIKEIPSNIHFKTAYFSLAILLLYMIIGDDEFYTEFLKHKQSEKMLEELNNHPIKQTRIYWLLSRCLVEEPKNRSIIFI